MSNSRLTSASPNLIGPRALETQRLSALWWWRAGPREDEAPADVTEVAAGGSGRKNDGHVRHLFFFFPIADGVKERPAGGGGG